MISASTGWQVVPLDGKRHETGAFVCGVEALDQYLRRQATQDVRRDLARVFVANPQGTPIICGYYSLSATSFQRDQLPREQAKRLPNYPVPAVILGRLAVATAQQGQGVGSFLLMDALNRVLLATQALAVHAIIVDAKDDTAAQFYRKYGFLTFPDTERRLFLPISTLRQL